MADPVLQIRGNGGGERGDPPVCPKISGGGGWPPLDPPLVKY